MLKPLEKFYCDTCGLLIEEPSHGCVEWKVTDDEEPQDYGWRIVHTTQNSPKKYTAGCQQASDKTLPLMAFMGPDGQAQLLAFLDVGEHIKSQQSRISVKNIREFVEFARRVSLPHYEEARQYWSEAKADGFFEGLGASEAYGQTALRNIVNDYRDAS